jgi:hypothetical protein
MCVAASAALTARARWLAAPYQYVEQRSQESTSAEAPIGYFGKITGKTALVVYTHRSL